jgi:hypothetical protein
MRASRLGGRFQEVATEEALKKREELAKNRAELAELLIHQATVNPASLSSFRIFVRDIRATARPLEYDGVVHKIVSDARFDEGARASAPTLPDVPPAAAVPGTKEQEARTAAAEERADQRMEALKGVVSSALGGLLPEENQIVAFYVNHLASDFAEEVFERGYRFAEAIVKSEPWPLPVEPSRLLTVWSRDSADSHAIPQQYHQTIEEADRIARDARTATRKAMVDARWSPDDPWDNRIAEEREIK